MPALIIIGAIKLALVGIGFIRATVYISYRDEVKLFLRVAGIKIGILPKKEKKIKYKKLSAKKFRKLMKKKKAAEEKKQGRKWARRKKKQEKKLARKDKKKKFAEDASSTHAIVGNRSFVENVSLVRELLSVFFSRFGKHFRIKVAKLDLTVASDDAAKTAVMYGVCAQSVAYILEILDNGTNIDYNKNTEVNVRVDYLAEKPSADIDVSFSLRVWHLLDILFRVAFAAIKKNFNK